jgi:hypothetical protein
MWNEPSNLVLQIKELRREATHTYERLVVPLVATHAFAQTLYGYMHRVFSFIDTLSSYWRGPGRDQSVRMVDFMAAYFGPNRESHNIAVQIWRHKLVHTALPRTLRVPATGRVMHYLIQWHENQMTPAQPHYTIVPFGLDQVFNLSCISLIEDLERAADRFVADLQESALLQANAAKFAGELAAYELKPLK